MKPGKEGELVIRGPHVMQGYWEDDGGGLERRAVAARLARHCVQAQDDALVEKITIGEGQ